MAVTLGTSSGSGPDQLVDLADNIIRNKLALEGEFDDRIAAMKELQKDLIARQGIVKTKEQADALLEEAKAVRQSADDAVASSNELVIRHQSEIANARAQADKAVADAQSKIAAIQAREDAVAARENAATNAEAQIPVKLANRTFALSQAEARVTERENQCAIKEAKNAAIRKKLDERIAYMTAQVYE